MNESNTSSVLVTGASGRTGREILRELNDTSFHVRALTRSATNRESLREAGVDEVVIGDLLEQSDARRAVENCDAILFAAGSSLSTGLLRPSRVVDGDGVLNLVEAAVREDVGTFVFQSSIGVGDSRLGMPLWARLIVLRWTVREKERAERALQDSGLEYVVIRPGWLTDDPATNDLLITEGGGRMTGSVPRADVASLMVTALSTPDVLNRTYEVVARDTAEQFNPSRQTTVEWNHNAPSRT
ncbi:SDR family oxidoreductase [Natrialba asiatica]|uniref:3-beta hydroxysteroid dehydrogenase/isomerase family protein n=1 Tax=Natrialba asiatica (strain ATCC 700177 / DSM 12278 / JCM 9576 / FERM P-10747 / NBRC 102637 / 172P1) TaxID=29540 RepID=M0B6J1_NATA1|nr:SDR family oxidoreductase [Natrialba asiatica]ELZ05888.1 3-beta hydroxysteroid dehydrogenase/isomerase family protein [Natrialba asiatica DSM 12278]